MELNEHELAALKRLGNMLFTPEESALSLGIDPDLLLLELKKPASALYKAYHSGRLERELELRESILGLATAGSSPAQTLALKLLNALKARFDE